MSHRKRKRSNSFQSNHGSTPPQKKPRKIRQTYLDSDSVVSSLEFHPTTHTFAASCFDGAINLYHIDEERTTTFSHSLHHPKHIQDSLKATNLQQLIQNNQNKLERLKQLQKKNKITFDAEEYENEDEDDDTDSDGSLSSISLNMEHHNQSSRSVPCKKTVFNPDGSLILGAWKDSVIGLFDYETSKMIHHFSNNEFDDEETSSAALTCMKMYNHRTVITGDCDGIIRCWDIRMDANTSQRQYQHVSHRQKHRLNEHEDGINCFECVPSKHRLLAGSGDGQLSVWDLRKSSDLAAIKAEMQRKKAKQRKLNKYKNRNRNDELLEMFGDCDEEEVKPKTLRAISDRMGDEILSLCLMKYGRKVCCGMTSGFMNVFSWNDWEWYGDRVKGHSQHLNCIVKYDEDCCITGCHDGVVRLISLYPHKFIHSIGTHDLNPIDAIAMSGDKGFVVSFATGNKRAMTKYNRTNRESLHRNHKLLKNEKDIIKVWDLSWHPKVLYKEQQKKKRDKYNRMRHLNQCKLPKGIKSFLELEDEDYDFECFDDAEEEEEEEEERNTAKQVKDEYQFSDDDEEDVSDAEGVDDESDKINSEDEEQEHIIDDDGEDDGDRKRRIRYKTFVDREHWIKSLAYRKKIRPFGRHDVDQYNNKKFFRDLCR